MTGFLTSMFGGGDEGAQSGSGNADEQRMDENGGEGQETESSSQSYEAGADHDLHLAPEISIHSEMGGTYDNPDGSTTTWSRTDDVNLTTDTHVVTSVNALITTDDSETF